MAESSIFFPSQLDPAKIGTIEVDILVEQQHELKSDVTEHPVEDGFPVADHVIRKPLKVSMVVGITKSPVTWLDRLGAADDKIDSAIAAFEQIWKNGQPISIFTPTDVWDNMVMTSAVFPRNIDNKNLLRVPCEFTQIRKVAVKTTEIPEGIVSNPVAGSAGETEKDGGTAKQEDAGDIRDTSQDSSLLSKAKKALEDYKSKAP